MSIMEGKSLSSLREPRSPDSSLKKFADGIGISLDISPSQDRLPTLHDPQLESLARHVRDYVQAPTIALDESVTHPQRRDFSSLVANSKPELLPWLESNRLRYNNLVGIANLPLIHPDVFRRIPMAALIFKQVEAMIPHHAGMYDELSLEQRKQVSEDVVRGLKAVYEELQRVDKAERAQRKPVHTASI